MLTNFETPVTIEMALDATGCYAPVVKEQLFDASGTPVKGAFQTKRDGRTLGVVGPRYVPAQETDVWNALAPLEREFGPCVVAAGTLRGESTTAIQVLIPGFSADVRPGDTVESRITIMNDHAGLHALVAGILPTRVFCANQMPKLKKEGWSLRHTGMLANNLAGIIQDLRGSHGEILNQYRQLAEKPAFSGLVVRVCEKLLKAAQPDWSPQAQRYHDEISRLFYAGIATEGRTAWDLLNAVTEFETHNARSKDRATHALVGRGRTRIEQTAQLLLAA